MASPAIDRRRLFASIGAVALAPAIALALPANAEPASLAWDRAVAAHLAANRAWDHHYNTVCVPLDAELDRIAPAAGSGYGRGQSDQAYWQQRRAAADRIGVTAANAENDRLGEIVAEREDALFFMPAPHLPALLWKLEQLYGPKARDSDGDGAGYSAKWVDAFMDDARRLLVPVGSA